MAFTEAQKYKIEITEEPLVQVRRADIVYKDGVEVGRTYERYIVEPGSDYSTEPALVADVAELTYTPEVVAAYEAAHPEEEEEEEAAPMAAAK